MSLLTNFQNFTTSVKLALSRKADKSDIASVNSDIKALQRKTEKLDTIERGAEKNKIERIYSYYHEPIEPDSDGRLYLPDYALKTANDLYNYYVKSELYTKSEVDTLIANISNVTISVVTSLPQTGESNIIYFVPAQTTDAQNYYDEYVYISGNWEMIGSTRVDLTDYARIEDTPFEITVSSIGTNSATLDKSWADIIAAYDEGRTINGYRAADSASPKQRYIIETSCLKRTNDFLLTMRYRFFNTSDGLFKEAVLDATYILSSGSVTWNNTVTTINDLSNYATKLYVTNQINGLSAVAKSGRYADLTGLPTVVNDVRDSDGTSLVANGVAIIPASSSFVISDTEPTDTSVLWIDTSD